MKTFILTLLAGSALLAAPAQAQSSFKPTQAQARKFMCAVVGGSMFQRAGESPDKVLERFLLVAAGADPDSAGAVEKSRKMAAYFKDPAVMGETNKGFFCNGLHGVGSLLWLAFESFRDDSVQAMIKLGADINVVDPASGRTLLDEIVAKYDWNSKHDETEWTSPWRRRSDDYLHHRYRRYYAAFRAQGARHAVELKGNPLAERERRVAGCLTARPEDAPKRYSDYAGGLATKFGALTPKDIPGVTTVSVRQAACLLRADRDRIFVLHAMRDDDGLPGARKILRTAAPGDFGDEHQKDVDDFVRLGQDKAYLVYCHSDSCFLSYNSALRLAKAGAKRVYWMRDGIAGWVQAGYPVERANGFMIGERD